MYNIKKIFSDCLPVVPVRGIIFLPGTDVRIEVGREFSKSAVFEAESNRDGYVLLVFQTKPDILEPEFEDFVEVGILARISVKIKLPNGNFKIKFEPLVRVKLNDLMAKEPFYLIDFTSMVLQPENLDEEQVLLKMVSKEVLENANFLFRDSKTVLNNMKGGITSDQLCDIVASELKIPENDRVKYLLTNSINLRLQYLLEDIEKEKNLQTKRFENQQIKTKRNTT